MTQHFLTQCPSHPHDDKVPHDRLDIYRYQDTVMGLSYCIRYGNGDGDYVTASSDSDLQVFLDMLAPK